MSYGTIGGLVVSFSVRAGLITEKDGDLYTVLCNFCLKNTFMIPTKEERKLSKATSFHTPSLCNTIVRGKDMIMAQCTECKGLHYFDPQHLTKVIPKLPDEE